MKTVICMLGLLSMPISMAMGSNLLDGLVGYWPFDGNANDMSGNENNGITHGVTLTNDRYGNSNKAYYFGSGNYISIPANAQINNVSDFTFSVWMKINSYDSFFAPIACKGDNRQYGCELGNEERTYAIEHNAKSTFSVNYGISGGVVLSNYKLSKEKWFQVAVTRQGMHINAYINGSKVGDSVATGIPDINTSPLSIGCDPAGSMEYLYGSMDDVFLYNRALSASEIKALMKFIPSTLEIETIHFDSNGGTGEMEDDVFEEGKEQKLSKNTYTKDGYVFQGWAETKADADNGFAKYRDEALITVDHDMTLYAVWANPALTLTAESADWSSGSITLCCTDADTSGEVHTYTLFYYDDNLQVWNIVDSAREKSADANGIVHLTDTGFSTRLGGIPPVRYCVIDDAKRISAVCETRNRHGIFVGVGEFTKNAELMKELAIDNGGFSGTDIRLLTSPGAKYNDVKNAFESIGLKTKDRPGDVCIVYFSTHGGVYNNTTVGRLVLDDKPPVDEDTKKQGYHEGLLAKHIRLIDPDKKGVGVVCIISACYSGAFLDDDNGLEECSEVTSWCHREDLGENVAWITAANAQTTANSIFDGILLEYGWNRGWAIKDKTSKTTVSFLDLYEYAIELYNPIAQKMGLSGGEMKKTNILRNVIAGTVVTPPSLAVPGKPTNLSATKDRTDTVRVEWTQGVGGTPELYYIIRGYKGMGKFENMMPSANNFKEIPEIASQAHPMQYAIVAFNGAGVAISDGFEDGWRTIDTYRATFYYNFPVDWRFSPDMRVTPYIEAGSSLSEELRATTELLSGLDSEGRYELMGWKTRPTDILNVVSRNIDGSWSIPSIIVNGDLEFYADWIAKRTNGMTQNWLAEHQTISTASNGDIARAAAMTAANGCRTVGECYALGIDPEDPNDDFKISDFKMEDGKPVITLNHTKDGSGNSFVPRIKTLGKANITDTEWREVPENGDATMRFFKVTVEMP